MTKDEKTNFINVTSIDCILKYINGNSKATRKEILDNATKSFIDKCAKNKISGINKGSARSFVGKALNDLLTEKTLLNKDGVISKTAEDKIIVDKAKCKAKLLELLKQNSRTKNELYTEIIKYLGVDKTKSRNDDNEIKGYLGQLLADYVKDNTLELQDGKYSIKNKTIYKKNASPVAENEFKGKFLNRLHENGGAFFERFFANVLEKYFTLTGRVVWDCDVIGGTDDGGIDIKIKISDDLGFVDIVMLQTKCRHNAPVTENEIRNFYGAINVFKASRGIFVTTSTFHVNADKLLHSLDNCVGIDGDGVFNLSKKVLYGMKVTRDGYVFDDVVFDI